MKNIKYIVLIFAVMMLIYSGCSRAADNSNSGESALALDFTLKDASGKELTLSNVLKNKKVVLDFWATWCPACIHAIPELEAFYQENKNEFEVIGINIQEPEAKVTAFVKKRGVTYPILFDTDGSVASQYNVRGIPTIVAIDKNNKVLYYGHSVKDMEGAVK